MSVMLKNDLDQIEELVADFDGAVNEECMEYDECEVLKPFITAGKAVFHIEYGSASKVNSVCPPSNALNFDTLIKNLDLDASRISVVESFNGSFARAGIKSGRSMNVVGRSAAVAPSCRPT